MTVHDFPALRADSLLTYLAALGLTGVVARQGDPCVRTWWVGDHLRMDTTVEDVRDLLVEDYRPIPAFSPWNGGSGFGEKDKNQQAVLEKIASVDAARLKDFTLGYRAVQDVLRSRDHVSGTVWDKGRLFTELHNRVPERALSWMDAVVVVGPDRLFFPSVYGTGGNDGRLEFSSNFHQRLIQIVPELGASAAASLAWATDALTGEKNAPLLAAPAGQFEPRGAGSPGTYSLGEGTSQVNPWLYVLMIEACEFLAASLTRVAGQRELRASVPFTVAPSPEGATAGSAGENGRGEFWAPLWSAPLNHRELSHLFQEARASWAGRTPTTSAGMYAATKSHGVDDRIGVFYRYGIAERNGRSFVAAPRDRVEVATRRGIDVAIPVEARARAFSRGPSKRELAQRRRIEARQLRFVAEEDTRLSASRLVDWLAELTEREHAAALSERESAEITKVAGQPRAVDAQELLEPWLAERAEHRLAAALASARLLDPSSAEPLPLHDFVVGRAPSAASPTWHRPIVRGYAVKSLEQVLGDVVVWRDQHADVAGRGVGRGVLVRSRGQNGVKLGYACRPDDVAAWVRGRLDLVRLRHAFAACIALDWSAFRQRRSPAGEGAPDPLLAVVQAAASGEILLPGFPSDAGAPESRQGWPAGWALRLRAGHVDGVVRDAVRLLNRSRVAPGRVPFGRIAAEGSGRRHRERRMTLAMPLVASLPSGAGARLVASLLTSAGLEQAVRLGAVRDVGERPDTEFIDADPIAIGAEPSDFELDEGTAS